MPDEVVIKVSHVTKNFVLPHERVSTIKGLITGSAKKTITKSSETQHALQDISFEIKKGQFFGIVGRNGSGKSTLLKILAGIYQPTTGAVSTYGKLVPFIELGVGFNPELTGRENVYLNGAMLGFSRKEIDQMYDDIVSFAELERFMDQKLKNYSSGMQVRLAFSMATRSEADILLIDEVLAVGDADFQRKCFEYFKQLKRNNKTVVFVSHDMSAIREYCDRAVLIDKSKIVSAGSANDIATEYSKMFLEQSGESKIKSQVKTKRWGNELIAYNDVHVDISTDKISINLKAKATQSIDQPIYGFSIKDAAGQPLLGINTQIKNIHTGTLTNGQTVAHRWELQNILKDGDYFLDLAIIDSGGKVYDWWEEALRFTIYKEERTPYLINPPISFKSESKK